MNEQEKEFTEMILTKMFGEDYKKKVAILDDKRTVYINVLSEEVTKEE